MVVSHTDLSEKCFISLQLCLGRKRRSLAEGIGFLQLSSAPISDFEHWQRLPSEFRFLLYQPRGVVSTGKIGIIKPRKAVVPAGVKEGV